MVTVKTLTDNPENTFKSCLTSGYWQYMLNGMIAMKVTTLYLTRAQRKRLKDIARAAGTNMSALIRQAIEQVYPAPAPETKA